MEIININLYLILNRVVSVIFDIYILSFNSVISFSTSNYNSIDKSMLNSFFQSIHFHGCSKINTNYTEVLAFVILLVILSILVITIAHLMSNRVSVNNASSNTSQDGQDRTSIKRRVAAKMQALSRTNRSRGLAHSVHGPHMMLTETELAYLARNSNLLLGYRNAEGDVYRFGKPLVPSRIDGALILMLFPRS